MQLKNAILLIGLIFTYSVMAIGRVNFLIPFSGQVMPIGTSGTFVTVTLVCTGFVPENAKLTAKKNGYPLSGATIYFPNAGNQTLTAVLAFGLNITGPIELSATVRDSNSSATYSDTISVIISNSSIMTEKPVFNPFYC